MQFLAEIDASESLPKKGLYSARNPTRVCELLHWKTLTEILLYLETAGHLSGNRHSPETPSVIDASCDIAALLRLNFHEGPISNITYLQKELQMFKLSSVIGEVHTPSQPIASIMLMMKDPLVRVSLGVSPEHAHEVSQGYYIFCKESIASNKAIAVGGLGLNDEISTAGMKKQKQVMSDFMDIAIEKNKPIRLLSSGSLDETLNHAMFKLNRTHPVQILNYSGGPLQIKEFLDYFQHGYIGLSSKICDPDMHLLETIIQTPLENIVVESNCPHQTIGYHKSSKPTDIITLINTISRIKHVNANQVARKIRININRLYQF